MKTLFALLLCVVVAGCSVPCGNGPKLEVPAQLMAPPNNLKTI